jgi:Bacterial SH3 domain
MAKFLESLMILRKSLVVGLLSVSALVVTALPGMARPATIASAHFGVNLRSGPSLQDTILDALPDQTPLEVLRIVNLEGGGEGRGDWYYVRSGGDLKTEGWVNGGHVSFLPSHQIYGTLTGEPGDVINLRSAPSTQSEVLHTGVLGDLVTVGKSKFVPLGNDYGRTGYRWHYVTYPSGAAGWVRGDLIAVWPKGCIITCPDI